MKKVFFLLAFIVALTFSVSTTVFAGTDLTVSCTNTGYSGDCFITPAGTPLFNETNIYPGDVFTQVVRAENGTTQNGTFAFRANNLRPVKGLPHLSEKITIEIHENAENGPLLYSSSLLQLINAGSQFHLLSPVTSQQFRDYYFVATFDPQSGNEYQFESAIFDLQLGFELVPVDSSLPTSTPVPTTPTGQTLGLTTSALPPDCSATLPSSAPVLISSGVVSTGGTLQLSWTAVTPVTTYAINFGTQPGVYQYGNADVGNVTSYTVTNLTPGVQYFFQVLGINDCAPGPRSNEISTTGTFFGGAIVPAPAGFTQAEVLGEATESAELASSPTPENFVAGQVLGESCQSWKEFLPWILLIAQGIIIVLFYLSQRQPVFMTKQLFAIIATGGSILIFYIFRSCDCYDGGFLAFLCQWYWLVALAESGFLQLGNYMFVERE